MQARLGRALALAAIAAGMACGGAARADDNNNPPLKQTNLVSDMPGLAKITDSGLKNPWGVSHTRTSPFWVSDQGSGTATLYAVKGATRVSQVGLVVTIPTTAAGPQGPTAQVANSNPNTFLVKGAAAQFIFADLNGTISAWNGNMGSAAAVVLTSPGAVYTGLAINADQTLIYAVDNAGGTITVLGADFGPVPIFAGAFTDPQLPAGLLPFNAQQLGGNIYVTYAPPGHAGEAMAAAGAGAVAVFGEAGNFISQPVVGGRLAAPWGVALAPPGFGRFSNKLLVGNFSYLHSEINAFDPKSGKPHGTIHINTRGVPAGGLWTIGFGQGGQNGSPDTLYFTDGINMEADGLFGAIGPDQNQ